MIPDPSQPITLSHLRDVSEWQGAIDWRHYATVAHPELKGCYIRAGRGPGILDLRALENLRESKVSRMHVGAYWYLVPGVGSAAAQVDALLRLAPRVGGASLRPALDCEDGSPVGRREWYLQAIAHARTKLGYFPVLYGSTSYLEQLQLPTWAAQCPLWLASYGVRVPVIPRPWAHWSAWQWTSTATDAAVSSRYVDDSYLPSVSPLLVPTRLQLARGAGGRLPRAL